MFKRRIRVAEVAFLTVLVLTALVACFWKGSEKHSKGTGEIKVIAGDVKKAEGVNIQVGTVDTFWHMFNRWSKQSYLGYDVGWFYKTRTAKLSGNQAVTGLGYEKQTESEQRNRMYYWWLRSEFPQKYMQGSHRVSGNDFSYDLVWYLSDGFEFTESRSYEIKDYVTLAEEDVFLYYYDSLGPKYYKAALLPFEVGSGLDEVSLCELDGVAYGYVGAEPEVGFHCTYSTSATKEVWDFEQTCEEIDNRDFAKELAEFGEPELHLTVRKGIYRFDMKGTAECVIRLGEYGDGFSYLWIVTNEEEHTLTVIGAKENRLLAYTYSPEQGTVEEQVLWNAADAPEVFEAWMNETAKDYELADMVTEEGRTYLCRTAFYGSQVNLSIFEDGNRVFEGEVLQPESDFEGLDFSLAANETTWFESVVDKVEIQLTK